MPEHDQTAQDTKSHTEEKHCSEYDTLGECLEAGSSAVTIAHMSGAHLAPPLTLVGAAMEVGAEIIHNPANNVAEQIVCGTGVAILKETINTAVSRPAAIVAAAAGSTVSTPVGGAAMGALVGTATYAATSKITTPLGHKLAEACHDVFEDFRKKNNEAKPTAAIPHHDSSTVTKKASELNNTQLASLIKKTLIAQQPDRTATTLLLAASPIYQSIQNKLQRIQASQNSQNEKIGLILGEIKSAYKVINEQRQLAMQQRNEELSRANFQGVIDGFHFINQVGRSFNNKGIEQLSMAGMSLAQGTLAVAQLTGTLGMTAATGLAMITPITAAAAAAFTLGSLIFKFGNKKNKKQAKAIQAQFQHQAELIMQVHQAVVLVNQNMMQGFEAMASGMRVINSNLTHGFSTLQKMTHEYFSKMGELIAQQHEDLVKRVNHGFSVLLENQEVLLEALSNGMHYLDFKLDDQNLYLSKMDEKLDTLLSRLQQLDFRFDLRAKQAMLTYAERFNHNQDEKTLFKLLQSIRDNLLLAAGPLKSLPAEEHINGWYQLNTLAPLFFQPEFHAFPFDIEYSMNLDWIQPAIDCLIELLPHLTIEQRDNDAFTALQREIVTLLKISSKPTTELIQTLASKEFLHTFFNHFRNKLDSIQHSAETILFPLRTQLSSKAMQAYAQKLLKENAHPAMRDALIKTVVDNSHRMAEQCSEQALRELSLKVLEYNRCLGQLQQSTAILCSLLQLGSTDCAIILEKINRLKPIHENRYRFQGFQHEKHDPSLPANASYTYLDLNTDNDFQSVIVSPEEIDILADEARDYAELTTGYLSMIRHFTQAALMTTDTVVIPETLKTTHQINLARVESPMKIKLQPEEIQQTMELMNDVSQVVSKARGKSVVYVIGVTGDGKSTLVNALNGSRYNKAIINGRARPQFDPNSAPEVCKVGTSISQSETLMPQLIDMTFGNEVLTYCDLPGFEGSRERAVTLCESYTPMLLNAAVDSVRGVLWVLSDLHFKTTRSKEVKEILSYLLQIADPDIIAQSLTIVITKGSKHLTKEHVINNLHEAVNAMLDSAEKGLLTQMITALEQSGSIIVSQLYDHQNPYREEIHRAILSKKALSPKAFDFSLYNKEQMDLKHQVDKALKHQALVLSEHENTINELSKCTLLLTAANKEQTQYGAQKEQHQATLEQLKIQMNELSTRSVQCQTQLADIERSNEQVIVHTMKHHIPGQTHEVEIDEPTGQYQQRQVPGAFEAYQRPEQRVAGYEKKTEQDVSGPYHLNHGKAARAYGAKIASLKSAGYTISTPSSDGKNSHRKIIGTKQVDDTSRPIYTTVSVTDYKPKMEQVPITRKVKIPQPIPQGHPVEYALSYQSAYPVTLKVNQSTGWVVKPGTEQKAAGYNATIIYEQGVGCTIDMDIMIAKKHTPADRARYAQLQEQNNQCDRALLDLKQRYQESEAQLLGSSKGLTVSGEQLQQLIALEQELKTDLQGLNNYLETNTPYFEAMQELSKLLTSGVTQSNGNRYRFHQPQPEPIPSQTDSLVKGRGQVF